VETLTATHCLDACSVIAYFRSETGADVLKEIIEQPTSFLAMHVCDWNWPHESLHIWEARSPHPSHRV
jgi:hypothetical protein